MGESKLMRPIFPSKMSGEEGWCLNMAIRLSAIDGNGCLGGGVREECSVAAVIVALEADEADDTAASRGDVAAEGDRPCCFRSLQGET